MSLAAAVGCVVIVTGRMSYDQLTPAHGLYDPSQPRPAWTSATTVVCSAAVNRVAAVGPLTITTPTATDPVSHSLVPGPSVRASDADSAANAGPSGFSTSRAKGDWGASTVCPPRDWGTRSQPGMFHGSPWRGRFAFYSTYLSVALSRRASTPSRSVSVRPLSRAADTFGTWAPPASSDPTRISTRSPYRCRSRPACSGVATAAVRLGPRVRPPLVPLRAADDEDLLELQVTGHLSFLPLLE